jgi:large subunit ribosomal protein L9
MKVILNNDIPKLGRKGQLVNVKPGYFRNYLGPQKLAALATPTLLERAQEVEAQIAKENEIRKKEAVSRFNALNGKTINVSGKLNKKGKLYSKISKDMVLESIAKNFNVKLGPDMLKFEMNIKEEGAFDIVINFGFDQVAQGKIKVSGVTE